jgi:threonine dehydrogenase-like Zn-dependent dehydrogenase
MKAAIFKGPGEIEIGDRPDPVIKESSDAVVRVVLACVCGSDLWYYRGETDFPADSPIGHEFSSASSSRSVTTSKPLRQATSWCRHSPTATGHARTARSE